MANAVRSCWHPWPHAVALGAASAAEIDLARHQLASGDPTAYVVLRVTGAGDGGSANLARTLQQLIEEDGCIARRPSAGETETLRAGLDKMGIAHAHY
jgi:hypothetical protein